MNIKITYSRIILAAVLIFTSLIISSCLYMVEGRSKSYENRCKLTLRALGSSQLAYQDSTLLKTYGTWDELVETNYLQSGYTHSNIIDNYNLVVFRRTKPVYKDGTLVSPSTFEIIAIPTTKRNRLRTFAITDEQTPLVWVGRSSEFSTDNPDFSNIELWEPLR